jgi:hypothetical protein
LLDEENLPCEIMSVSSYLVFAFTLLSRKLCGRTTGMSDLNAGIWFGGGKSYREEAGANRGRGRR